MERFAKQAVEALNSVLESPIDLSGLEIPPDPNLGDFAFPCFKLAKQYRKAPPQVAQETAAKILALKPDRWPTVSVKAVGPYVNFTAAVDEALRALLTDFLAGPDMGSYGKLVAKSRGSWVLEYSSPNVAKPFNIYHLRPTALGAALDRIGRFRGFDVISINHLGDWGTQYGKLAVAFRLFGQDLPAEPTIDNLVDIYVKFHALEETNKAIADEAREAFVKLEKGDPEMTALWKKCVDISMKEFIRIYARLGVHFDHIWGESFYKDQLAPLIADLKKRGLLIESEGAWVVPVTDENGKELPPCILQKSDGATIYATRDLAAAIYRYDKFKFDRMTYIVGQEQKLHFQQVFGVLRKLGYDWAAKCEHVAFGLYRFKDAKMSTRKGNFVTFDSVLELAKERVLTLMNEREEAKTFPPSVLAQTSEAVAIGALVFHDLHSDPVKDVEFDLESAVSFEGETGPYLQYAHTRCLSILRKAQDNGTLKGGAPLYQEKLISKLTAPQELALVKTLGQLPLHLERTLKYAKASQLAQYLIDVTKVFNAFYRECKVLTEDAELTQARLMLVESTRRILAQGLNLLGIPRPERM